MTPLKHPENESAPEAADVMRPALYDVGYIDSFKKVVESHFGDRWLPLKLAGLIVLVFWPVAAYWDSIKFNRSLFVTEWLKIIFEGILLFLILEIVRHRSVAFDARQTVDRILLTNYAVPARTIITALKTFRQDVGKGDMQAAASVLRSAWRAWKAVEFALSDVSIQSLPYDHLRNLLLRCKLELKPARCESILTSLRAMRSPDELVGDELEEFEELLDRYTAFLAAMEMGGGESLEKRT